MANFYVYTDASMYPGNCREGKFSIVIYKDGIEFLNVYKKIEFKTNINHAEYEALVYAKQILDKIVSKSDSIYLYTDSKYALKRAKRNGKLNGYKLQWKRRNSTEGMKKADTLSKM